MAGHNKWSKIKRKKAINDGKKSGVYTKMAKAIMVAVKSGGGADPDNNFRLKAAIEKAKEFGLPRSNIERAIEKGSGKSEADDLTENLYEGYLPGGVAVMVFTATDNTNRTYSEVKNIFTKASGSLSSPGSVAYLFEKNENDELLPMMQVEIKDDDDGSKVLKALEALEEHEDVIDVVSNWIASSLRSSQ